MLFSPQEASIRGALSLAGVLLSALPASSQQQPAPQSQPGTRWTEEQIRQAIAPVRAGRKLTPKAWPNGARVAICFSFDVNNEQLAAGQTEPVQLSTGECGAVSGLPRVLALLDRHAVPATFFIPAVSAMLHPQVVSEILKRDRHEIATNGWMHESLPALDSAMEEERLLRQAVEYLTKVTGRRPVGYRAPGWAYSHHTITLIRQFGFLYESSLMAMDEPYEVVSNGQPTGVVALPTGWTLVEAPYPRHTGTLPSPELVFQLFRDEFDVAYQEGTMLMLTLHPHNVGHRSAIVHLDKLVSYMKSKPGVWFATGEQIARYVQQQADGTK